MAQLPDSIVALICILISPPPSLQPLMDTLFKPSISHTIAEECTRIITIHFRVAEPLSEYSPRIPHSFVAPAFLYFPTSRPHNHDILSHGALPKEDCSTTQSYWNPQTACMRNASSYQCNVYRISQNQVRKG